MLIFAIDDEPKILDFLHDAIAQAKPDAEIIDFTNADTLLSTMEEHNLTPDVVFADIKLRGESGLQLAVKIKTISPQTKIIFVTGYSEYAADAYRMHANGYIIKPVKPERIREELEYLDLMPQKAEPQEKLRVKCFGRFEVFWHGKPLLFHRRQTLELFAFLIDCNGEFCTSGELISALWEDIEKVRDPKHYLRVLTQDLRESLSSVGMEKVLVRRRNQWAIQKELLDCDYYRMLEGDPDAINAYRGEYMNQYSWGELTAARLHFQNE